MAAKKAPAKSGVRREQNTDNVPATVHVQVDEGETVTYKGRIYGDRATLQVPYRELALLHGGEYTVLNSGADVEDMADR
jgi:hypothetical protein